MEDLDLLKELLRAHHARPTSVNCELSARCIELIKTSLETHYDEWYDHLTCASAARPWSAARPARSPPHIGPALPQWPADAAAVARAVRRTADESAARAGHDCRPVPSAEGSAGPEDRRALLRRLPRWGPSRKLPALTAAARAHPIRVPVGSLRLSGAPGAAAAEPAAAAAA